MKCSCSDCCGAAFEGTCNIFGHAVTTSAFEYYLEFLQQFTWRNYAHVQRHKACGRLVMFSLPTTTFTSISVPVTNCSSYLCHHFTKSKTMNSLDDLESLSWRVKWSWIFGSFHRRIPHEESGHYHHSKYILAMPLHRLSGSFKVCFLCVVKSMCWLHTHCSLHCHVHFFPLELPLGVWDPGGFPSCMSQTLTKLLEDFQLVTQLCIINTVHVYALFSNKLVLWNG